MPTTLTLPQKQKIRNVFDTTTSFLDIKKAQVDAILSCDYTHLPTERIEEYVWRRIGLIFRVCTDVATLLGDQSIVGERMKSWIVSPNQAFGGKSALAYLEHDPVGALVHIPGYLDSLSSGDFS